MTLNAAVSQSERIASALRWWSDAGCDVLIDEAPRRWLADAVPTGTLSAVPAAGAPPLPIVPDMASLSALTEWLLTADALADIGPPHRRIRPSGDPASGLMVLADCPDLADADAGHLLGGDLAELFDNMLAALGRDRSRIYLASVSPGRPPSGTLSGAAFALLAPLAKRHVELVAPKQLWLLGSAASRAILGLGDIAAHGKLHHINLDNAKVDVVVTAHPRFLTKKDQKARAWTEMQRLNTKDTL